MTVKIAHAGKNCLIRINLRQWVLTKHEFYTITFIITLYSILYKEIRTQWALISLLQGPADPGQQELTQLNSWAEQDKQWLESLLGQQWGCFTASSCRNTGYLPALLLSPTLMPKATTDVGKGKRRGKSFQAAPDGEMLTGWWSQGSCSNAHWTCLVCLLVWFLYAGGMWYVWGHATWAYWVCSWGGIRTAAPNTDRGHVPICASPSQAQPAHLSGLSGHLRWPTQALHFRNRL